jgi:hypothetical protein
MASSAERINALETGMSEVQSGIAALLAMAAQNAASATPAPEVVTVDTAGTATVNAGKSTKATATGWRDSAEEVPESVKRQRQERDPNSRCSLEQASYAAGIVSQYHKLAKRVTDGIVWYQGVKTPAADPSDIDAVKAEAAKRAEYDSHVDTATAAMLAAFNVYAEDATFDPTGATYGQLWDWLSSHAPVSLQKAKREHAAAETRRENGTS